MFLGFLIQHLPGYSLIDLIMYEFHGKICGHTLSLASSVRELCLVIDEQNYAKYHYKYNIL